ncbi:MAG: hypothetical protein QM754_18735 [Tepidisphaeraceae bacterium]
MAELTRRELIQGAVAAGVSLSLAGIESSAKAADAAPAARPASAGSAWLDTMPNGVAVGTTWGEPWPRGAVKKGDAIRVDTDAGQAVAAQTWTTAYWPDGSVKWTAVAVGPDVGHAKAFKVSPGTPAKPQKPITVTQADDAVTIDTGVIQAVVAKAGNVLIRSVKRDGRESLTNGRLVAQKQNGSAEFAGRERQEFVSSISEVTVEQTGPVRAVVKVVGKHAGDGRQWLPFVVRFYFYAGSDVIRVMHSFVFDGDEYKEFLSGLGVRFDVPLKDELYNRHVRFVGQDRGVFAEAVRGITGMRRDPGDKARDAQIAGHETKWEEWAPTVFNRRQFIPAWGDYTLTQLSADGFQIRKRTKANCAWIPAAAGKRSIGAGYVGGATGGGVSFGLRDFWQRHPVQLDIRNAAEDAATVTLWMYSPDAPAMDLRMYHDVMGMDTYDKQNEGLNITYEDYEPGYGTPYGIARSSELYVRIEAATPSNASLADFADVVAKPPMVMANPTRILDAGVFGKQWTLPDRSNKSAAWVEDNLTITLDQYLKEIDQRSWYGFWDYGDVMHTYDNDRHQWRYDVGGYAWDNSELSTDLWLWLSVLRTGRADLFRMSEAMCRHTGEVDVYHLGRFKGLGTRHGVQHWSDSSKQSRISTPIYRRIFYFLTADERVGDLMDDQMQTIEAEKKIVIGRKIKPGSPTLPLPPLEMPPPGGDVDLGGLNWGNAMAAWVTKAERTGDAAWHAKIVKTMQGVGDLPKGFFTSGWIVNIDTGEVKHKGNPDIGISHLMACFGLPEIANELISLYGDSAPKFADAWAQYGRLYNGNDADRRKELGDFRQGLFKEASLKDTHSRITAFAAVHDKSDDLAKRAWAELLGNKFTPDAPQKKPVRLQGPEVLNPIDEIPMGTNGAAQWGLAAILCLALIGDKLPQQ